MTLVEIANLVVWFPLILSMFANFPQIVKNWYLKTTMGISSFALLILYINVYTNNMYVFYLWLPYQYRLVMPIMWVSIILMVLQTYIYGKTVEEKNAVLRIYVPLTVALVAMAIAGIWYPYEIGHAGGWICFMGGIACRFPQIYKNFKEKSMYGYSLIKVIIATIAACVSLFVSVVLALPLQSILSGLSAIGYRSVQLSQYWFYRGSNHKPPKNPTGI